MNSDEALAREAALLPAHYVNRVQMSVTMDYQVRLTFAEETPAMGMVSGRCAVTMSAECAVQLRDLIDKIVKKVETPKRMN